MGKIALAVLLITAQANAADETIVDFGTHKGVIVSPSGLVLTADHCGNARTVQVRLHDGTVRQAALKYSPPRNGIDESQVYHILGGGEFPYSRIATESAGSEARVSTTGMIAGKITNSAFSINYGNEFQTGLRNGLITNWRSIDRDSGSPLFNENGEVVGLLSMSGNWPRTYWIGLDSIKYSIQQAQPFRGQRRLVMFSNGNKDSLLYEQEIKATSARILVIKTTDSVYGQWAAEHKTHTGRGVTGYPTFWVESTNETRQEAYRPGFLGTLLGWFKTILGGLLQMIFGGSDEQPQQYSNSGIPPSPISQVEELRMENLTVVILAAKQEVGAVKGIAIKLALSKASGPLKRKLNEALEGKAQIDIIPERTDPGRYQAVVEAAGITVDKAAVLVLVRSQSLGLKTLIAGRVERAIEGKIPPDVPVEIIFQRLHGDDFAEIMSVVNGPVAYERGLPAADSPGPDIKSTVKAIAASEAQKLISGKLQNSENALLKLVGDKLDKSNEEKEDEPVSNGILAMLVSALGAGYAGEKATKAYRAAKVAKALKDKIFGDKEEVTA